MRIEMKRAAPNQKKILLAPKTAKILETVGEQIRLARLRRKLSVALVAERAGVSRQTVWKVEKGNSSVAIGIYAKVLRKISCFWQRTMCWEEYCRMLPWTDIKNRGNLHRI